MPLSNTTQIFDNRKDYAENQFKIILGRTTNEQLKKEKKLAAPHAKQTTQNTHCDLRSNMSWYYVRNTHCPPKCHKKM